jgi:N-acetylmuramoyl-L-alanine amidase-like protein/SH3 domain-containing protein
MKKTQGKFVLYDITEFANWLSSTTVSRIVKLVQNHHTFIPSYKNFTGSNHFTLLKGMENSHLERGFAEIAQNLTTFPDGTVAVCRSFEKIPAGILGANTGGICIENVGNFDTGKDVITSEHRDAVIKVNALLCRKFALTPDSNSIIYHHWYDLQTGARTNGTGVTKSCPGTGFFGGNTVATANGNLMPLIAAELQSMGSAVPANPVEALFAGRVSSDTLNVRVRPEASSKKVKTLTKGVLVNAFEQNGTWFRIDPNESHWVNGKFLERLAN